MRPKIRLLTPNPHACRAKTRRLSSSRGEAGRGTAALPLNQGLMHAKIDAAKRSRSPSVGSLPDNCSTIDTSKDDKAPVVFALAINNSWPLRGHVATVCNFTEDLRPTSSSTRITWVSLIDAESLMRSAVARVFFLGCWPPPGTPVRRFCFVVAAIVGCTRFTPNRLGSVANTFAKTLLNTGGIAVALETTLKCWVLPAIDRRRRDKNGAFGPRIGGSGAKSLFGLAAAKRRRSDLRQYRNEKLQSSAKHAAVRPQRCPTNILSKDASQRRPAIASV